jgi:hypothetical protein
MISCRSELTRRLENPRLVVDHQVGPQADQLVVIEAPRPNSSTRSAISAKSVSGSVTTNLNAARLVAISPWLPISERYG